MAKYSKIQEAHTDELLSKPGVIGTAVGEKLTNGTPTGQQAILIFVQKKYTMRGVIRKYSQSDLVPTTIDGVPTDVIEVGRIRKELNYKGKIRPIRPGYSVGHGKITAGTMGGVFRDKDNQPVILSNNHVLANENRAKIGDLIYQPGPIDTRANRKFRGWPDPVSKLPYIGTLKKFIKIKKAGNSQDSAIAAIHPKLIRDGLISDLYPTINSRLSGFAKAKIGDRVQKCGRTTGYTTGRILGLNASFTIEYDFGVARFDKCVVLSNMSDGGDSVGGETTLYYRINGQLRYSTFEQMYDELEVEQWLDNERFIPKDTVEVLSTTDLCIYRIAGHKRDRKEQHIIWRKVNWLYKHWADKRIFKIWTRDHREITITEDHSLFGGNKMRPDRIFPEVAGSKIKIGTQLLVPSTLETVGEGNESKLDDNILVSIGLFLGDGSFDRNNSRISISCGGNKTIQSFFQQYISSTPRFAPPSHLAIAEYQNNKDFDRKEFATKHNITTSAVAHSIRRFNSGGFRKRRICCMKKNGDITISNVKFAREMLSFGLHNGFATKSIPAFLMVSSINNIKQLLKGLFSSDGGIKFNKNKPPIIAFGVHNKILAEQCRTLLWRCGIRCSISHENTKRSGYKASCEKSYRVVIAAISDVVRFLNEIGFIGHDARVAKAKRLLANCARIPKYCLTSKSVVGIEEQFVKRPVYDLSVEGERFIANGFVCHNSGSIIQNMNEQAVALLFAGSPRVTIANPFHLVKDHYKLKLWTPTDGPNTPPVVKLGDNKWVVYKHAKSTVTMKNNVLQLHAHANHHCCVQREITQFRSVSCVINTGTDRGATWGPGLVVKWPHGYIKLNLRHHAAFGGYFNGSHNISIGKVKPNTDYGLRIRNTGSQYIGEIKSGGKWYTVVTVPLRVLPLPPTQITLGKTDPYGQPVPYRIAGAMGDSTIKNLVLS